MSKKKTKCRQPSDLGARCLSGVLDDAARAIASKDWTALDGADALADEELEALETGAVAAISMVRAMLGAFGAGVARSARMASPTVLAEGIMTTAVCAHRELVVDAEDAGAQAQKPGMHVSVEFKG